LSQTTIYKPPKIVYGDGSNNLPEHLNGLGYVNILYLLLQIEVKKKYFFLDEKERYTHLLKSLKLILILILKCNMF
jgi:hypothetical protein